MNSTFELLREALCGLDIALVGGDARSAQVERLRRTFDLHDVVHRTTRRNDPSPRLFESALYGPRVALAVWLCGLSCTSHGKQFRLICNRLGLPWLDCPHVPHPNLLVARVDEFRLLDVIARRRAEIQKRLLAGGGQ